MVELLWFLGGAVTYQLLAKLLRIAQIYVFFQEIHAHILIMLDAASKDLETAVELKKELIQDCDLEEGEAELIISADTRAINTWKVTAIYNILKNVPAAFKSTVNYDNWNQMQNYLNKILKDGNKD